MRPVIVRNPPNPWSSQFAEDMGEPPKQGFEVYEDRSRTILAHNTSPDIPFRWSLNPYRGCQHACAYCYARPTHEYLGFGAGTDFDRIIVIKRDAAKLLRAQLSRRSWKRERIVFSGVTDCYQPLEASLGLTRACLQVCLELSTPVGIITKAPLIERDLDLLRQLHERVGVHVVLSIGFFDPVLARAIEPQVATPDRRMKTVARLAQAGLDVTVLVAPIIPGLNDDQIPSVLRAARDAGAAHVGYTLLRLPGSVAQVFSERVAQALPLRAERILARTREAHGNRLNEPRFHLRHEAQGEYGGMIKQLFAVYARRYGFQRFSEEAREPYDSEHMLDQVRVPFLQPEPSHDKDDLTFALRTKESSDKVPRRLPILSEEAPVTARSSRPHKEKPSKPIQQLSLFHAIPAKRENPT